jgi:hypothetical protein
MARTPRGRHVNPGVLEVRPVQAGDRSEGAPSLMCPSHSMTAMGSEDDAVALLGQ